MPLLRAAPARPAFTAGAPEILRPPHGATTPSPHACQVPGPGPPARARPGRHQDRDPLPDAPPGRWHRVV